MKKIATSLTAIFLACLLLAGCGSLDVRNASEKQFTVEEATLTLTSAFTQTTVDGYTGCFDSPTVAVLLLKESFDLMDGFGDYSLEDYAQLVYQSNASRNPGEVQQENGLTYLEYEFHNDDDGKDYKYFTSMYKAGTAFWLVQFACETSKYDDYRPDFIRWAGTVTFSDM